MSSAKLHELAQLLEVQGIKANTPEWELAMLQGKVDACKQYRGTECDDCTLYDDCTLIKKLRIRLLYNPLK